MENDLWMNFKQHASVCNLANELCRSDLSNNTERQKKKKIAWNFRTQFPRSSFTSSHCGFVWCVENVSAECYFSTLHQLLLHFSQEQFLDSFPGLSWQNISKTKGYSAHAHCLLFWMWLNISFCRDTVTNWRHLFMYLLSMSSEWWQIFHQGVDKDPRMPFSRMNSQENHAPY